MRADDQAKIAAATVNAVLEYLHTASNSSPLKELAQESLIRAVNELQLAIGRGELRLITRRGDPREREAPLFADVLDPKTAHLPPPPVDPGPQVAHAWTPAELSEATALLPDGIFAGYWFDRVSQSVISREHLGLSLLRALQTADEIEAFGVNEQGTEDPRGPFLRFRKV